MSNIFIRVYFKNLLFSNSEAQYFFHFSEKISDSIWLQQIGLLKSPRVQLNS